MSVPVTSAKDVSGGGDGGGGTAGSSGAVKNNVHHGGHAGEQDHGGGGHDALDDGHRFHVIGVHRRARRLRERVTAVWASTGIHKTSEFAQSALLRIFLQSFAELSRSPGESGPATIIGGRCWRRPPPRLVPELGHPCLGSSSAKPRGATWQYGRVCTSQI